jgi:hypothetical protein
MMAQTLYKGKFGDQKPTESQLELLKKMGVKNEIVQSLDRVAAFELIKKLMTKYYEEQTRRRFNGKIIIKW